MTGKINIKNKVVCSLKEELNNEYNVLDINYISKDSIFMIMQIDNLIISIFFKNVLEEIYYLELSTMICNDYELYIIDSRYLKSKYLKYNNFKSVNNSKVILYKEIYQNSIEAKINQMASKLSKLFKHSHYTIYDKDKISIGEYINVSNVKLILNEISKIVNNINNLSLNHNTTTDLEEIQKKLNIRAYKNLELIKRFPRLVIKDLFLIKNLFLTLIFSLLLLSLYFIYQEVWFVIVTIIMWVVGFPIVIFEKLAKGAVRL